MATTVQKWGNSLGLRIPKALAEQVNLTDGTEVELKAADGVLTVRPARQRRRRRKYKLVDLLAQLKPRHRHGELHPGGPRGRERI